MIPRTTFFAALFLCLPAFPLSAAIAVSNLSEATTGGTGFAGPVATSFTTGSALPSWDLESVALAFSRDFGNSADLITVEIHSDSSGVPGTNVATLSGDLITIPGTYLFAPLSTLSLTASTTYWLVLKDGNLSGDITRWNLTNSDDQSSALPGWSIGNDVFSNSGSWTNTGPTTGQFAINVVPEPSAALLAGLGALSLAFRRRRA